jgi:hypothetical protein
MTDNVLPSVLPDIRNEKLRDLLDSGENALANSLRRVRTDPDDCYTAFANAPAPTTEKHGKKQNR